MKNILLFMTDFYGYYKNIISELEKQNYNVTWFLDKVELTQTDRVISKFDKTYATKKFDTYFAKCLESVRNQMFDEILIVFGANFFKKQHIMNLRNNFPNTRIIYYAWDSVENFPGIKDLLLEADISYTFDYNDSKRFNVGFLPLFYINNNIINSTIKYDVSTVMSFFLEKSQNVKNAIASLPENSRKLLYLKIRDKLYFTKMKLLYSKEINGLEQYFQFDSINSKDISKIFSESKAIIDCPLPNQNGLTMRTFETLALGKKLITTNENIKYYDFYSPNNIFIVDGETRIPLEFFSTDFDMGYKLSEKYSICNFVKTLTNNKGK